MKKLMRFPFHVLWQAVALPTKVLLSSLGLTFRAGYTVGSLPVKGGAAVTRVLGWKIIGALTVGLVIGFFVGRQVGLLSHNHDHDTDLEEAFDGVEGDKDGVAA